MAHVIIEYSANIRERLQLQQLVDVLHTAALATGVFPVGGIRSRAYEAQVYRIADGHPDNAFVHISLRVGHGRDVETRKRACEQIFAAAMTHLDALFREIPLGIALEMQEIDPVLTFKQNNLHRYVAARQGKVASP